MTDTLTAARILCLRRSAHNAERAYKKAQRDHIASEVQRRAWVTAKAKLMQAEVRA